MLMTVLIDNGEILFFCFVSCLTNDSIINSINMLRASCFSFADSGLVVPSVPYELHKRLLMTAEQWGLSLERRLEAIGVCSSQMALTLLGGPNR